MEPVLHVEKLTKDIKGKRLVDHLTFDVLPGEVFGFLGPNGAGKTTTIRMLVGLVKPTSGKVTIAGYNLSSSFSKAMRQIGSIVENPELYGYLTGWENLKQSARMLENINDEEILRIVQRVHLSDRIHDKVKTYSLGMKQRLGIALALLGNPKLLILDEPTNGLDPSGIRELRKFVRELVETDGISVFISSHLLSEVQLMCDRVAIIHKGKMIKVSPVTELLGQAGKRVEWHVTPQDRAFSILKSSDDILEIEQSNQSFIVYMDPASISKLNRMLVKNNIDVHAVAEKPLTLEELFMELTGGTKDD